MNFRRPAAAAAAIALAAVGLSACSSSTDTDASATASASASADTSAETVAALEGVTWTDGEDGVPVLSYDSGLEFTDTGALLVNDGDGEELTDGIGVNVSYVIYYEPTDTSATASASPSASASASASADATETSTGPELYYSTYDTGFTEVLTISEDALDPNLYEVLKGAHVGAQVLYGTIDSSYGYSLVMAVTVENTTPLQAEGTSVEQDSSLPQVTLADDGTPSIDLEDGDYDKPSDLVSEVLIQGDGDEVEEGQTLTVQYTGWLWDGTQFDSSWDRGYASSFTLTADSLIQGWVDGLTGVQVGSQILLIIPPDLAYGDEESDTIPADSTLVFVIDVLDAQ
ncbi:FKBP-type peptidyl-prolyl cis-trans isomerase [Demequina salsinemoris]|uniref:FKBP-type peptidyl-prolyl cis-trans isomerase n=1 Tax=Demequina salsinemoris TaxID=577470 RepID=UPI000783877B|nr:FKBP-type peptidyl-prolyl cis-trans isomerase [Demequina salsinemoris]